MNTGANFAQKLIGVKHCSWLRSTDIARRQQECNRSGEYKEMYSKHFFLCCYAKEDCRHHHTARGFRQTALTSCNCYLDWPFGTPIWAICFRIGSDYSRAAFLTRISRCRRIDLVQMSLRITTRQYARW